MCWRRGAVARPISTAITAEGSAGRARIVPGLECPGVAAECYVAAMCRTAKRGVVLAQLIVRDLEQEVTDRLAARAARHGRTTEDEVREILRSATLADGPLGPTSGVGLGSRIAARFSGLRLSADFAEIRGELARAAEFTDDPS